MDGWSLSAASIHACTTNKREVKKEINGIYHQKSVRLGSDLLSHPFASSTWFFFTRLKQQQHTSCRSTSQGTTCDTSPRRCASSAINFRPRYSTSPATDLPNLSGKSTELANSGARAKRKKGVQKLACDAANTISQ